MKDPLSEDFEVGAVCKHFRGKTVTAAPWNGGVSYGGVNFSLVLGLASPDCVGSAIEGLGLDSVRLSTMVHHGDTLYAYSEVLTKSDVEREDAGIIVFRHYGVNQRDELVTQIERRALIKRRSH